jgi:hypothetical protein
VGKLGDESDTSGNSQEIPAKPWNSIQRNLQIRKSDWGLFHRREWKMDKKIYFGIIAKWTRS